MPKPDNAATTPASKLTTATIASKPLIMLSQTQAERKACFFVGPLKEDL
jgi:hypothetical protein